MAGESGGGSGGDVVRQVRDAAGAVVGDVAAGRWRRAGIVGVSLGVVAAGAVAGVALERLTVGRDMRRRAEAELDAAASFGSLRGTPLHVPAPDGTDLYVELDGSGWAGAEAAVAGEAADAAAAAAESPAEQAPSRSFRRSWLGRKRGASAEPQPGPLGGVLSGVGSWLGMPPTPPLTVVFAHGYCLNQDSWHFQREAFRDGLRLVFWDQRSHGRSERSRSFLAGEPASIDQLGGDLGAVIDAVAPTGPLVLVGHSMGGMTIMALADQRPELFAERVAGVAFLGTTSGSWRGVTLGLPGVGAKMFHRVGPGVIKALGRQAGLVERGRRLSSELTSAIYHRFSFGSEDIDPALARFAQQLLESTPVDVVAEFFPVFAAHEKTAALAVLRDIPTLVMAGQQDLLTPPSHSEAIAAQLPDAELEIVPDTGHLLMLERPGLVDARLADLLERAAAHCGAPLPQHVHDLAQRA
ncbi:pimeloyl-ACP methyl ester carboxylesterase [Streptacidiphilus sp. MAP12-20]|uniref:alpha/beta fold hydrolase n=1 Tax=Streptacidiphilus sp. MAP12-20 TaxID=3156299 RepID=UPI003514AF30